MINMCYKKLTGLHARHNYAVTAPAKENESPLYWTLQCETIEDQKLNISDNDLLDKTLWQPAD